MIEFNKEKIDLRAGSPTYRVNYYICYVPGNKINFTAEEMKLKKWKYKENDNKSCFADFKNMMPTFGNTHKKSANRILYICDKKFGNVKSYLHLTDEEIERWVEMCKPNRLMPKNIGKHFLETMNYIVNLERVSYPRLYMYLTAARYIQEMPAFVRAMVHLVDEVGLDFFIAFGIASGYTATNSGHHIIPTTRVYSLNGFNGDMNKTNLPVFNQYNLTYSAKLAKFAFKTTKETPAVEIGNGQLFKLHYNIDRQQVTGNAANVERRHLLNKELIKAVRTADFTNVQHMRAGK